MSRFTTPAILVLLAVLAAAVSPARAQAPGKDFVLRGQPARPAAERDLTLRNDWEDFDRVIDGTLLQMSADEQMEALEKLGLLDYLRDRALRPTDKAAGDWVRIGPVGGFGADRRNGRVSGIQLVEDPSVVYWIYAGTCQGGLWRTSAINFGVWTDLGRNLPNPSVRAFWVDPTDFTHIIVGTGDYQRYTGAGMFETFDEGVTWNPVSLPFGLSKPDHFFRMLDLDIDTDPGNPQRRLIAVCTLGPIYSADGGATWARGLDTNGDLLPGRWTDVVAHPNDPSWLYAAGCEPNGNGSGVWVSQDYGETWGRFDVPNFPAAADWGRASLAISRSNPATLAIVIVDHANSKLLGVYSSTNAGFNWTNITNELKTETYSFGGGQIGHAQAIAFDPVNPSRIYLGAVGLATSGNGGASWDIGEAEHGIFHGHDDITQIGFDPVSVDDILWICNDGGLYFHRTTTGITYDGLGDTSTGLACSEVDYLDAEREMVAIGLQDNGSLLSVDAAATWEFIEGGDGAEVEIIDPIAGDMFFTNGFYAAPRAWHTHRLLYGAGKEDTNNPAVYMPRLHYSPFTGQIYTHGLTSLHSLSAAGTLTWNLLASEWQGLPYRIRDMWSSWSREQAFWFTYWPDVKGGADGDEDLSYVYHNGSAWTVKHWEDFNPSNQAVLVVKPSREWPDEAWVGVNGSYGQAKIFHLREGGDVQVDITGNLHAVDYIRSIAVMPFDPDHIWVGTDVAVFETTDGGVTWTPFMDGLPIGRCSELHLVVDHTHGGSHTLYLATDGRGVWKRDIPAPPIYYVSGDVATSGDGTVWGTPYKTIEEALAVAVPGSIIALNTDTYSPPRMNQNVKIVTWRGTSRLE